MSVLDFDGAMSLMMKAPATPGVSDWDPTPDDDKPELPAEEPAAAAADDTPEPAGSDATTAEPEEASVAEGEESPSENDTNDGQDDQGALPIIDPPASWKDEEKEVFKSLPRKAQEAIARREQDRTTELRNLQNQSAEKAKTVDAETARLKGLADQIEGHLQSEVANLARDFPDVKSEADFARLAQDNPARFAALQARLAAIGSVQQTRDAARAETARKSQEFEQARLGQAKEALLKEFPAWSDPEVAKREITELQDYAIKQGVPEAAARQAIDPHTFRFVQKAMAYDKAQAAAAAARERTPPKPVLKPAAGVGGGKEARATASRADQMARLAKTGDIEDALKLMLV